jgi:gliding-associated putative ABC transporter substrate-binding component GldG
MKNKLITTIILVAAIVLIANIISQDFFVRLDFSEDKQYTLNQATKDILKNLQEPVTIKAYFSENLPPNVAKVKKDFKEMLIEYNNRSKGMLVYEFIDPSKNEETEQEAMQAGVQPIMIDVREKDQMKQQKAYMGAVISMGERKEVLPFVQPGAALEYTLSKAIKKLSIIDKPTLGIMQGHGEPTIQEIVQAYNELNVLYNVEPFTLSDTTTIPDRIKTITIIRPKDTISQTQLQQLDQFLAKGGKILIATSRVNANLQTASSSVLSTGLEKWLKGKGLSLNEDIVVDASCSQIQVVQNAGGFQMIRQIQFPYIPLIKNFSKTSAIGGGLETLAMPFSSSIDYIGAPSNKYTPIAFTSEKSGSEMLPVYFNIQKNWTESDFPKKNIVVAASLEGKLVGEAESKIVLISNGDFIINGTQGQGQQQQQLAPDNINLFVNSIDWLSDDTGLIGLRTKAITARPIEELSDASRSTLKWLNFLLPILLIIGYGFFRAQLKRNKRIKRMEESYV